MKSEKTKRRRGWPMGTGLHQRTDAIKLDKLARMKVADPTAKTAVIIRQLIDSKDTGGLRRLQRAFEQNGTALIAAARERAEAEQNAAIVESIAEAVRVVQVIRDRWVAYARSPKGQEDWGWISQFTRDIAGLVKSLQFQPRLVLLRDPTKARIVGEESA